MNADFLQLLETSRSFLLTGHERPDGDCIGAQIAMFHLLRALGKEVTICNPDPAPPVFADLTSKTPLHSVAEGFDPPDHDVLVLLDCAHRSRLGRMRALVERRRTKTLVIDHHVGSEQGDGDACYVDSSAPATGALVMRLYRHFGVALPLVAAEGVFLSLVSDTGWFRYSNTTAEVYAVAAELVEAGVDSSALYDGIHRRNHPESVAFLAMMLGRSQIELDGKFGYVCVTRDAVETAARIGFDLDAIMEPLRSVHGMEVVAMLKQIGQQGVKLSLRASRDVDVQRIAADFGGGGHKKASGASLDGSMERSLELVRDAVRVALDAGAGSARGG